jgi:hypothetical protein
MPGDIEPTRYPNAVLLQNVVEQPLQAGRACRVPDQRMCSPTDIIFGVLAPSL